MVDLTQLQTDKSALHHTRVIKTEAPALQAGQTLMKISALAVTTNNITYAAFGDTPHLRYWHFFPTHADGWGHMPAWGFAEVVDTTVEGLEIGERFYGYWPIASHLVVQPVRVSERGFYDGAPHREALTSAYNQYQRTRTDAAYRKESEAYQMLLRPLYITSFMLADYLEDNSFFGAEQIVFSSASSKTAFGTAFSLMRAKANARLISLTSSGNREFVESLGCYDEAITYDSVKSLNADLPTLYVDFSGDDKLRSVVHHHFGDSLKHDCYAGSAQSHEHLDQDDKSLPGPAPQPYFAPYQIKKRNSDWGAAEVTRRFNEAQLAFIERVGDSSQPWMLIKKHQGFEAAQELITELCEGKIDPLQGHIVRLD